MITLPQHTMTTKASAIPWQGNYVNQDDDGKGVWVCSGFYSYILESIDGLGL